MNSNNEEGKKKISIYNGKIQLINASSFEEAIKLVFVIYFNSNRINPKKCSSIFGNDSKIFY
ncbi:unnamed protein product [Callosobruchus maculatus]|uniref:Uncharacterized protein n=1 Tax=Callosobruchus maculatus TaxID=64391 RepID=A0A653DJT2_CALMS|nr:unnamed protein product [Callosobruchus maculatus]